jgi:hypothetical protein
MGLAHERSLRQLEPAREQSMLDLLMLALGIGFLLVSMAYAYGCDRL